MYELIVINVHLLRNSDVSIMCKQAKIIYGCGHEEARYGNNTVIIKCSQATGSAIVCPPGSIVADPGTAAWVVGVVQVAGLERLRRSLKIPPQQISGSIEIVASK
jgi:hypothetical protein